MSNDDAYGQTYLDVRDTFFGTGAEDLGVTEENFPYPVFGILMEVGIEEGSFTIVCLADGTANLYLSDGAWTIGGGHHATVQAAADYFLAGAQHHYREAQRVTDYPVPALGIVSFFFLTGAGVLRYDAPEAPLEGGEDPFSKLYRAGDRVLQEIDAVEHSLEPSSTRATMISVSKEELVAHAKAAEPVERVDLHGQDLRGLALAGLHLAEADLGGVDLTGSTSTGARFTDVDLRRAHLVELDGERMDLVGCRLAGADLSRAKLAHLLVDQSSFSEARLDGADLSSASLIGVEASKASFVGVVARSANFEGAALAGASFRDADLTGATFGGADLRGVDFRGADLRRAWLGDSDLRCAQLEGAELEGAELEGAQWTDPPSLDDRIKGAWEEAEAAMADLEARVKASTRDDE